MDILCHSDAGCAVFLLAGFCNPLWRLVPSISGVEVLPMAEQDLYGEIGEIRGKQEMIARQLVNIEGKVDKIVDDISEMKSKVSNVEGRASVWGILTAAITTALINLGLRK